MTINFHPLQVFLNAFQKQMSKPHIACSFASQITMGRSAPVERIRVSSTFNGLPGTCTQQDAGCCRGVEVRGCARYELIIKWSSRQRDMVE
jgi:hypothetical protein